MISNRQNRRRGRGGQRGGGNRPDNRSKGNAAQLLDKYKGLARDAQMSGDRVQQEYYLQFADHYFRVLEEHRIAQEEKQEKQQPKQGGRGNKGRDDDQDGDDQPQQQDRPKRQRKPKPSDDEQSGEQAQDKPKRRTRKKPESDGGEAIADALPPAIRSDDDDEDSEAA